MSCIQGWWNLDNRSIDNNVKNKIESVSSWWDPDSKQYYQNNNIYLSTHKLKLSQKDLSPNLVEDKESGCVIIGDIRIDNAAALTKNIKQEYTNDLDLILNLYLKYNSQLVKHIIGAFVFVIWDPRHQQLFIARDHIGIKALHYSYMNKQFIFGTQKKSILEHGAQFKNPNWAYIVRKMHRLAQVDTDTEYINIKRLKPAHFIIISKNGNISEKEYWTLDINKRTIYNNSEDYSKHFAELFSQSVLDRIKDVDAFGSHLSGGLDSSGITGVAASLARENGKTLHTFSLTVPQELENEPNLPIANENSLVRDQIKFSNIQNYSFIDKPILHDFRSVFKLECEHMDGFSETNNLQTENEVHHEMKMKNLHVGLSGFPGDELVTSHVKPYYLEYLERKNYIKYFTSKHKNKYDPVKLLGPFVASILGSNSSTSFKIYDTYLQFLKKEKKKLENHFFNPDYILSKESLKAAIKAPLVSRYRYDIPTTLRIYQRNKISRTHTNRRIESETLAGLRSKVTYRYPMTDIRLLQYTLSIPMEQKIDLNGLSRWIFRRGMQGYVAPSIASRANKKGTIRPMVYLYSSKMPEKMSKFYWVLKNNNATFFLDEKKIESYFEQQSLPNFLPYYFQLSYLKHIGKINL